MKKIKYLLQISVLFLYAIVSTGCYTIINSPNDQVDLGKNNNNEIVEESGSDTLNVDDSYIIINNYICSNESSCCGHDYCHTDTDSHSYHNCDGHCSLSFNWWTGTWVSYSCNYCHHWSCSGHHHGHFYGHGYFYHDYYHNNYHYGYHDGFYDGYWWGYNDGWWNNGENNDDYSDGGNDSIERRENSYNRSETDESGYQAITFEDRSPVDIPNHDNPGKSNYIISDKKNGSNSSSSIIINSIVDARKSKNSRVEKRNNTALNIAQFLFTSYTNSNKSKSSKNDKSSNYSSKSKSSKNDKSSNYSSKSKSSKKSSSYKSKSSKKSSSKSSKSSKKSSRSKGRSRL